jgi:hypothetical protein
MNLVKDKDFITNFMESFNNLLMYYKWAIVFNEYFDSIINLDYQSIMQAFEEYNLSVNINMFVINITIIKPCFTFEIAD